MTVMLRKQVYIEPRQDKLLKQWAQKTGKTEAEIFRQALDHWVALEEQRREAQAAWEEERAFIEACITQGPVAGERTWTRQDLYKERLGSHGDNTD